MWNKDTLTAIVLLLVSAIVWWGTGDLSEEGAIFPRAIDVVLIILGVTLLIRGFIKKDKTNPFAGVSPSRLLIMMAALAIYVGLIPFLGFILSSMLFLTFAFLYYGEKKLKAFGILKQVLFAIAVSAVFYAIFHYGFVVPLPTGSLWSFLS